jgi:hypothetical protein
MIYRLYARGTYHVVQMNKAGEKYRGILDTVRKTVSELRGKELISILVGAKEEEKHAILRCGGEIEQGPEDGKDSLGVP